MVTIMVCYLGPVSRDIGGIHGREKFSLQSVHHLGGAVEEWTRQRVGRQRPTCLFTRLEESRLL